jgi:hypothetical protein
MKVRYTIRDILLWSLLAASVIGWITDHRREEQIIKLQTEVDERLHRELIETQDWVKRTGTALVLQRDAIRDTQSAVEKLTKEIHAHYTPNDQAAGN